MARIGGTQPKYIQILLFSLNQGFECIPASGAVPFTLDALNARNDSTSSRFRFTFLARSAIMRRRPLMEQNPPWLARIKASVSMSSP
jgi:hypothetical protein